MAVARVDVVAPTEGVEIMIDRHADGVPREKFPSVRVGAVWRLFRFVVTVALDVNDARKDGCVAPMEFLHLFVCDLEPEVFDIQSVEVLGMEKRDDDIVADKEI